MKKISTIINDMLSKGFTSNTAVDLSFANGNVARCTLSRLADGSLEYAEMYGELTQFYDVAEMLRMNLIAIENVR